MALVGCLPAGTADFTRVDEPRPPAEPEEPFHPDVDEAVCEEAVFRGSLHRQGVTAETIPRSEPELLWVSNPTGVEPGEGDLWMGGFPQTDAPDDPPEPFPGGMFIGPSPLVCGDDLYTGTRQGSMYRIDPETADVVWEFVTAGEVESTPVIGDGKLAFGGVDSHLYVLDPESGDLLWSDDLGEDSLASPAMLGGRVFTSTKTGEIFCYDASSGEQVWVSNLGSTVSTSASFGEGGQRLLVGERDGDVTALRPSDGGVLWRFDTGQQVLSSPAWRGGAWYVGSWSNRLFALEEQTGDLLWSFEAGANVTASPAVTAERVVVGSWDWNLYFLDRGSGELLHTVGLGGDLLSSPVVDGETVLQISEEGVVSALDLETAELLWSVPLGVRVTATPAVHDGQIYVEAVNGDLFALGAE